MLLVARDEAYVKLTYVMVAPITTRLRDIPTAVPLEPRADGVVRPCAVYLDHIQAIHMDRLETLVVRLRLEKMAEVERAIRFAFALGG